jgi:hypothetical protein
VRPFPSVQGSKSVRRIGLVTFGLAVGGGAFLAGCSGGGSGSSTIPSDNLSSPLAATESWFKSINDKDFAAAQEHFVPSARSMMDWGGGDTATWSSFTKLQCKTQTETGSTASVYCTFNESPSSSEGNPDSFWTISLTHTTSGDWLINNYGQG